LGFLFEHCGFFNQNHFFWNFVQFTFFSVINVDITTYSLVKQVKSSFERGALHTLPTIHPIFHYFGKQKTPQINPKGRSISFKQAKQPHK